jgi:hypothetical protein
MAGNFMKGHFILFPERPDFTQNCLGFLPNYSNNYMELTEK